MSSRGSQVQASRYQENGRVVQRPARHLAAERPAVGLGVRVGVGVGVDVCRDGDGDGDGDGWRLVREGTGTGVAGRVESRVTGCWGIGCGPDGALNRTPAVMAPATASAAAASRIIRRRRR